MLHTLHLIFGKVLCDIRFLFVDQFVLSDIYAEVKRPYAPHIASL